MHACIMCAHARSRVAISTYACPCVCAHGHACVHVCACAFVGEHVPRYEHILRAGTVHGQRANFVVRARLGLGRCTLTTQRCAALHTYCHIRTAPHRMPKHSTATHSKAPHRTALCCAAVQCAARMHTVIHTHCHALHALLLALPLHACMMPRTHDATHCMRSAPLRCGVPLPLLLYSTARSCVHIGVHAHTHCAARARSIVVGRCAAFRNYARQGMIPIQGKEGGYALCSL